jgi:RNA polymerase sigma-70 factor (ECF subfamily)
VADETEHADLDAAMARAGDPGCFRLIYRRAYPQVYAAAMGVLRNGAYAEEVSQEVFLELWCHADRYVPDRGSALGWLVTMARNRAIDRVRAERASRARDTDVGTRYAAISTYEDPADLVADRTQYDHLRGSLGSLTEAQRDALVLSFLAGYSHGQLAARFGIPLGTVKSRIHAALVRIRRHADTL